MKTRVFLSNGERIEILNRSVEEVVRDISDALSGKAYFMEITDKVWVNPKDVSLVVQVGE